MRFLFCGQRLRGAEAVEGSAGLVIAASDAPRFAIRWQDSLLLQTHDGLEEVVVEPQLVIQAIDGLLLSHRVEAIVTQVGPYQSRVLLFHEAVDVLLVGAATGEVNAPGWLLPETDEMVVEEL